MNNPDPWYKILQSVATSLSLILIPIIIAIIANSYQSEMTQQKINSDYIGIAIGILKEEPSAKNKEIRTWAVDIINHYSEVKIGQKAQNSLIKDTTLQVGDLLFYRSSKNDPSHIAIYAGDGQIIHASYKNNGISHEDLNRSKILKQIYEYNRR
ncbi:NlpC/P60 family protein [Sulfuricurvum sp.]|uniref:NlpC/P60 family protein n=1 Tax=Sulfuricurvum sp. TaxID=2025608 RepID=UPI003BB00388